MLLQLEPLDARIPAWDTTSLIDRCCPFCGSAGTDRFIRPDRLRVRQCPGCHCFFVSPSPSPEQLTKFYATYYARHRKTEFTVYRDDPVLVREMLALDPQSDVKVRTLSSVMTLNGKRVLDVGSGLGQNLVLLRKLGAIVSGIDMDQDAVEFAHTRLGLENVFRGDILSFTPASTYDLVTLHDVIEHPLDPLEVLQKARHLLSPAGMLSIWTPNASSFGIEERPTALRVDLEHMQYLTFDTCRHIAKILKMRIVHLAAQGTPKLGSIKNLSDTSGTITPKRVLRGLLRYFPGFVRLNAWRRRLGQRRTGQGTYHLFCILRDEAEGTFH